MKSTVMFYQPNPYSIYDLLESNFERHYDISFHDVYVLPSNIIYEQVIFIEGTELVNTQNQKCLNRMSILRALIVVWLMSAKPLHGCQEKWKPDLRKDFLEHHKICIIILWN